MRGSLSDDENLLVLELVLVVGSLDLTLDGVLDLSLRLGFLVSVLVEDGRGEALRKLERERNLIIAGH